MASEITSSSTWGLWSRLFSAANLLLLLNPSIASADYLSSSLDCRCFPGDSCWPSPSTWSAFNNSVAGNLIATIPLAHPCHDPGFSEEVCATLQSEWLYPEVHYNSSSSIMAPFFTNYSCSPFSPEKKPCLLGDYIDYAVNVKTIEDVRKTIAFAEKHNIRLVIRNTGHDYNGKSTGAGAIGIWTHHLKDIKIIDYSSPHYTGKAIKVGAGVQGIEAYEAADQKGLAVVGGECPTVGLAGGYTQGGGHSALASKFGLAADQTLEWEVISGDGRFLTATREKNSDLYWALSGGGGGTYGVVWSMTAKAHPDFITAGLNLTFTSDDVSQDAYYEAIGAYHSLLPQIVDTGAMSVWYFTNASFAISPLTGPNMKATQMRALVKPFTDKLRNLGIKYTMVVRDFPSYLAEYDGMQGPIQVGIAQYGGWLMPRSVIQSNNEALTGAYRNINNAGGQFIGVGVNVSRKVVGDVENAVLPAWRDTLIDSVITTPWNFTAPPAEMVANQVKMTEVFIPQLRVLAPESGCYLNEGDFRQPDFQNVFYGKNYGRLRQIKAKYDPNDIFYATTAVGSDEWKVLNDGRLCKT